MAPENLVCFQGGDPNGNRTRVFAVKGDFPFVSMARPPFHHSFRAMNVNGLRMRGDEITQGTEARRAETPKSGSVNDGPVAVSDAPDRSHTTPVRG